MRTFALVLLLSSLAFAESQPEPRLAIGLKTLGGLSLTQARTQGGLGGAVSAGWRLDRRWQLNADFAWLVGLGSNTLLRVGAGWQPDHAMWRPMLRADVELGFGGSLDFSVGDALPPRGPTVGLTLGVAPLRWAFDWCIVSLMELHGGVATEFVAVGGRFSLTLLALSVPIHL